MIVLLRAFNPDGSPWKEWGIQYYGEGLMTFYGACSSKSRRNVIVPLAQCRGSRDEELQRRIKEKLAKGYQEVKRDECDPSTTKTLDGLKKQAKQEKQEQAMKALAGTTLSATDLPKWF